MALKSASNLSLMLASISVIIFFNVNCKNENKSSKIDTTNLMMKKLSKNEPWFLFVGTYSGNNSKGIYIYSFDSVSCHANLLSTMQANNPSYLCIHKNKNWVYAVSETDNGMVNAYSFDTLHKKLTLLNSVSAKGNAPCFISNDNEGKFAMVANYNSGNVVLFPLKKDGSLDEASSVMQHTGKSINTSRQTAPHAHMVAQIFNNYVYANDLGIDKTIIYKLDTSKKALENAGFAPITADSGPRHFSAYEKLKTFYVLSELKGTIEAFNISDNGTLTRFQTISTIKNDDSRYPGCADIHITPNGKYLYASNRGDVNNIVMFSINQENGTLSLIGFQSVKGKTPRNFVISPNGEYLLVANQDSGNICVFEINENDGTLIDKNIEIKVPNPVCLKFWF